MNLGLVMISGGYGFEYTYGRAHKYQSEFKAAQREAQEQRRGLWSPSTCNGRTGPAAAPATVAPSSVPPSPTPRPAPPAGLKPVPPTAPAPTTAPAAAKPAAAGKPGVTLRFHFRTGTEKSEPAIYVERPGEWEQETGHKITQEPIPGGRDYVPKVLSLVAGGTVGDVLFTGESDFGHTHLVRNNVIEPVDGYIDRHSVKKTDWLKPIVDTLTHNGKMYGMPKTGHPGEPFIWVNYTLFDKAGIKRPAIKGNTFEQLREWAIALSKGPKEKRDVYGYWSSVRGAQGWGTAARMRGSDVVDKDGKTALMDSEAWWQWADWNRQLILNDAVHPLHLHGANLGVELPSLFAAGKLAMFHGARYLHFLTRSAVKDKKDVDWGVIQFPRPTGARGNWMTVIDTHSGTQASKFKEEGFSLINALSDQRFAYLVGKTQGYLTGRADNLQALKELAEDPFLKLQYECGPDQEPNWRAANLRYYEVEAEVNNQMDEIWLGKKKLDRAHMQGLKKAVDAILAKPDP